jgi:hypothetical protein
MVHVFESLFVWQTGEVVALLVQGVCERALIPGFNLIFGKKAILRFENSEFYKKIKSTRKPVRISFLRHKHSRLPLRYGKKRRFKYAHLIARLEHFRCANRDKQIPPC